MTNQERCDIMKLYEVPCNTKIRLLADAHIPPGGSDVAVGEELFFRHIDGMYSLCFTADREIVHPMASTEVEIVLDKELNM